MLLQWLIKFLRSLVYGTSYLKLSRSFPIDRKKYMKQSMTHCSDKPGSIKMISQTASSILNNAKSWKSYPLLIRLDINPLKLFKKFVFVFFSLF
jgi:hypothetical protein